MPISFENCTDWGTVNIPMKQMWAKGSVLSCADKEKLKYDASNGSVSEAVAKLTGPAVDVLTGLQPYKSIDGKKLEYIDVKWLSCTFRIIVEDTGRLLKQAIEIWCMDLFSTGIFDFKTKKRFKDLSSARQALGREQIANTLTTIALTDNNNDGKSEVVPAKPNSNG
jgi:hypothetical protein